MSELLPEPILELAKLLKKAISSASEGFSCGSTMGTRGLVAVVITAADEDVPGVLGLLTLLCLGSQLGVLFHLPLLLLFHLPLLLLFPPPLPLKPPLPWVWLGGGAGWQGVCRTGGWFWCGGAGLWHWGQGPKYPVETCWTHCEHRQQMTKICPAIKCWIYFKYALLCDQNMPSGHMLSTF